MVICEAAEFWLAVFTPNTQKKVTTVKERRESTGVGAVWSVLQSSTEKTPSVHRIEPLRR